MPKNYIIFLTILLCLFFNSNHAIAQDKDTTTFMNRLHVSVGMGYSADIDNWLEKPSGPDPQNPNVNKIYHGWNAWWSLSCHCGKKENNLISFTFSKSITKAYYFDPAPALFNAIDFVTLNSFEFAYGKIWKHKKSKFSPNIGFYVITQKTVLPYETVYKDSSNNYYTILGGYQKYKDVAPGFSGFFDYSYQLNKNASIGMRIKVYYSLYWYIENVTLTPFVNISL